MPRDHDTGAARLHRSSFRADVPAIGGFHRGDPRNRPWRADGGAARLAPGMRASASMRKPTREPRDDLSRAIAYALVSNLAFSLLNVVVKWQSATYSITELVFFRSSF